MNVGDEEEFPPYANAVPYFPIGEEESDVGEGKTDGVYTDNEIELPDDPVNVEIVSDKDEIESEEDDAEEEVYLLFIEQLSDSESDSELIMKN